MSTNDSPRCNIVIVEDYKEDRSSLMTGLREDYGHDVKAFRDEQTLWQADRDGNLSFPEVRPLVVILDIMLAEHLQEDLEHAPRWGKPKPPTPEEARQHVDDERGLRIGEKIRQGQFSSIPHDTPILFFTARRNEMVRETIATLGPAACQEKPAFLDDIQERILGLILPNQ